jgi:hypothetical protein
MQRISCGKQKHATTEATANTAASATTCRRFTDLREATTTDPGCSIPVDVVPMANQKAK